MESTGDARDLFWESVFSPGDLGCSPVRQKRMRKQKERMREDMRGYTIVYRPWSISGTLSFPQRICKVDFHIHITYIRSIRFAGSFVARYIAKHKHTVGFSLQKIQEQRSTSIKTTGHLATGLY
jgi:hypothetical protein